MVLPDGVTFAFSLEKVTITLDKLQLHEISSDFPENVNTENVMFLVKPCFGLIQPAKKK